jgi:ubiquinone biosynthesis monooxygenase Coq7
MTRPQDTLPDLLVAQVDRVLRSLLAPARPGGRETPGADQKETELSDASRRHAAGLMRVNHAGEIAAQGLYHGQSATARLGEVREAMDEAAEEEFEHLKWCEERLTELGSGPSVLGPLWYAGAFAIGAAAGLAGDRWSLGFVAETERQVVRHLDEHLERLPDEDHRSRAILEQMREDEARHGETASAAGGAELPVPVRGLMKLTSRIMTRSAYWF